MTIQMPDGSSRPLPSRTVRSRPFSHVIGASSRRSSASPFAAPRTSSIVPSVMMNGTTRRPVTSTPLIRPHAAPAAMAPAAATSGHEPSRSSSASTTVLSAITDPTDRSIPPATITIVMPKRGDTDDCRLAGHQLEIRGAEKLGPIRNPKGSRRARAPQARRLPEISSCAVAVRGHETPSARALIPSLRTIPAPAHAPSILTRGAARPRCPRDITAIRSHSASSSGKYLLTRRTAFCGGSGFAGLPDGLPEIASCRPAHDQPVNLRLAADVDASRRLVEHQDVDVMMQQTRERHLLLIAAGKRDTSCAGPVVVWRAARSTGVRARAAATARRKTRAPALSRVSVMLSATFRFVASPSPVRFSLSIPIPWCHHPREQRARCARQASRSRSSPHPDRTSRAAAGCVRRQADRRCRISRRGAA